MQTWGEKFIQSLNMKEVVVLSEYVTPLITKLLPHIKNFSVYREQFFNNSEKKYKNEIFTGDIRYINFLEDYFSNDFNAKRSFFPVSVDSTYVSLFLHLAAVEYDNASHLGFFKSFEQCLSRPMKLQIIGDDKFLIDKFLKALQSEWGNFYLLDCSNGYIKPEDGKIGLIFKNVQLLNHSQLSQLVSDILTTEYNEKSAFLVTQTDVDVPVFHPVYVPSSKDLKKLFPVIFYTIILEKNMVLGIQVEEFKEVYSRLVSGGLLKNFFEPINSVTELESILVGILKNNKIQKNLVDRDFWYDLITSSDNLRWAENTNQYEKQQKGLYILRREKNGKYQVIFNGKELHFEKKNLDGFLYLGDLYEHPNQVRTGTELFQLKIGVNHSDRKDRVNLTDKQTIVQTLIEIEALKKNKQEQIDSGNGFEATVIQDEINKRYKYINNSTKFDKNNPQKIGEPKTTASRSDNEWRNVKGAIDRLKSEISGIDAEFLRHFNRTIIEDSQTKSYRYVPEPKIVWKISSQ
ncbi:MAG: hypothetical protein IPM14_05205 [bacterium]|nr:hypothetical protein [bacterium]